MRGLAASGGRPGGQGTGDRGQESEINKVPHGLRPPPKGLLPSAFYEQTRGALAPRSPTACLLSPVPCLLGSAVLLVALRTAHLRGLDEPDGDPLAVRV